MQRVTCLLIALVAVVASVSAAPTTSSVPKIKCIKGPDSTSSLYAGDYNYGTDTTKLGYKSVTETSGATALWVVKATDAGAKPFTIAHQDKCNSTALHYYSNATQFNAPTPVKLVTDIVIDNRTQCVGLNSRHTTPPSPSDSKTHIILLPCDDYDTAEAQSNQFWSSTYKYVTLFPLVGPWSAQQHSTLNEPTWPIYPPSSSAKPQAYRAGPSTTQNGDQDQRYVSFRLGQ